MATVLDVIARVAALATWPVVVLVVLLVYRRPMGLFLAGLGARVTKLSVFKVQLELAAAEVSAPSVVLNELRDTTQAAISDSSMALYAQVQDTSPADFAVIDLGVGDEWITSRLYIAAALLERMRGLRAIVFVESRGALPGYLLAVAPAAIVRWSLAGRYPWLELAYAQAIMQAMQEAGQLDPKTFAPGDSLVTTDHGTLGGARATTVTRAFLSSIQDWTANPAPSRTDEWVQLNGYRERAEWVTVALLRDLLPAEHFDQQMPEMRDDPQAKRVRAVLRRRGPFVALVDPDGRFKRLVDRGALLEEAAAQLGEEPNG